MESEHDTPTDEQRIAQLESDVNGLHVAVATLRGVVSHLARAVEVLTPQRPKNCRHCGRQLTGSGPRCHVCGKGQ